MDESTHTRWREKIKRYDNLTKSAQQLTSACEYIVKSRRINVEGFYVSQSVLEDRQDYFISQFIELVRKEVTAILDERDEI